jgi:serine/threonine protein phosphatase PrpC
VEVGFKTDVGRSRVLNEDNLLIGMELGLVIVADGMGSHRLALAENGGGNLGREEALMGV